MSLIAWIHSIHIPILSPIHIRFKQVEYKTVIFTKSSMFTSRHPQDLYTYPHPDPQTGRLHRARSVILSSPELIELRAAQRTFEGAYIRTSLSQFSFALVVLKIFTAEFYSIGALFAAYGAGVLAVGLYRRREGNRVFFVVGGANANGNDGGIGWGGVGRRRKARIEGGRGDGEEHHRQQQHERQRQGDEVGESARLETEKRFRTSGNVVVVLTLLSVMAYATLLVLTLRLRDT